MKLRWVLFYGDTQSGKVSPFELCIEYTTCQSLKTWTPLCLSGESFLLRSDFSASKHRSNICFVNKTFNLIYVGMRGKNRWVSPVDSWALGDTPRASYHAWFVHSKFEWHGRRDMTRKRTTSIEWNIHTEYALSIKILRCQDCVCQESLERLKVLLDTHSSPLTLRNS